MLPVQILLNNLLYSFAQLALPVDEVDKTYIQRPQRLRISYVRNYMLAFGPISSIFDFGTFFVMLYVFKAGATLFQTAWFVESLLTQSLVILVIRTRTVPFFRSKPSKYLLLGIFVVLGVAVALPFIPFTRELFSFQQLPLTFLLVLAGFIVLYLGLAELMKIWFFRRFSGETQQAK
jgi:Mg2+-importing ATPase